MIVIVKPARAPRRRPSLHASIAQDNVPTPEMIEERAAEIRQQWSPRVKRRRQSEAWQALSVSQMPLCPRRKGFWGD